jgi:acyl-CoA hydrolase
MKVGDLVEIEKWCKNKGRRAVIVRTDWWDDKDVYIQYFDGDDGGKATRANLILVSES